MSNLDFTLERAKKLVQDSEQLAVALSLIHEQDLTADQYSELQSMTCTLILKLIDDLQTVTTVIGVYELQHPEGGLGDAPMLSAVNPSPC